MYWFATIRQSFDMDETYAGYLLWSKVLSESLYIVVFEFGLIVLALAMLLHNMRLEAQAPAGEPGPGWRHRAIKVLRIALGIYLPASLLGLLWELGGSLGSSLGPMILSMTVIYGSCAIWLWAGIINKREAVSDLRTGQFLLAGMATLVPAVLVFPWLYLFLTSLGTLLVAAAATLFLFARRLPVPGEADRTSLSPWPIVAWVSLWLGIILTICFLHRAVLLESAWLLLPRLMACASFLLFGLSLFISTGVVTRPVPLRLNPRALLLVAALLGIANFAWRACRTVYTSQDIPRTLEDMVSDLESNNCNRFGKIPVELAQAEVAYDWRLRWPDGCKKWQQVLYLEPDHYQLGPIGMAEDYYYGHFELTDIQTTEKLMEMLKEYFKENEEYPDYISDKLIIGVDANAPWSRVCEATGAAVAAGFRRAAFLLRAPTYGQFSSRIAAPPWIVGDLDECRDASTYHGGTPTRVCMRQMDRAVAFCPGLLGADLWGSQGTTLERLKINTIPQVAASYSKCLGDVDLEALYSVLASEYWSKPMAYLQVNLAAADAEEEARTTLTLPGRTRWRDAFGRLIEATEKGRNKTVKPVQFTAARRTGRTED